MFTTQQIACTLVKLPQLPQLPQSFSPELFPRAGFRFYVPWVSRKPLEISIPRNIPQLTTNDDENAGGAVWVFEVWGFKIVQKACPAYPKWEPPWFPKWEPVWDIRDKVALGPSSFHKQGMCSCCPPKEIGKGSGLGTWWVPKMGTWGMALGALKKRSFSG